MTTVVQLYEHTNRHGIVRFRGANCMIHELYLIQKNEREIVGSGK